MIAKYFMEYFGLVGEHEKPVQLTHFQIDFMAFL